MLAVASRLVSGNLGLITVARKPRDSAAGSSLRSARWLRCSEPGRRIGCYPTGSRWASPRARPRSAARTAPPAPRSSGPPFIPGQRRLACQRALLAVPIAGGRSDQPAHDDPTMMPAAISRAPTAPALFPRGKPQGLVRSPLVRPPEPGASAPRSWGPGHRLPLVALMPQWRQNYPITGPKGHGRRDGPRTASRAAKNME
jgi:hypothetical protein